MVEDVDANGDGEIDFPEFLQMMSKRTSSVDAEDDEVKRAFAVFDKDGNGTIDRAELKRVYFFFSSSFYLLFRLCLALVKRLLMMILMK
jgi:Ca2+-binding EF-hand superfamily protein